MDKGEVVSIRYLFILQDLSKIGNDDIDAVIASGMSAVNSKEEDDALKAKVQTYTQFDDLVDFAEDHQFKADAQEFVNQEMIKRMADQEAWNEQFEALDWLRVINKYHREFLMENIVKFQIFIKESVENLRSGIQKNSLMFATEFFKNIEIGKNQEKLVSFVQTVLPSVLFKTVYDKVFISKEAKTAVTHSLTTCHFKETLEVIINDGCLNKSNKKLMEDSYSFIGVFIKNADSSFFEANPEITSLMVNTLTGGVDSMPRIKKASTEVFKDIHKQLG